MFQQPTVLIVGAGASAEANLPVGAGLAEKITEAAFALAKPSVNRENRLLQLRQAINENTPRDQRENVAIAANKIVRGIHLAGSIDAFIDRHSDDTWVAKLGKAFIASEILDAEQRSSMRPDGFNTIGLSATWYHRLASMLFAGHRRDDLRSLGKNLTIITFNYDRCIEHYLLHALKEGFSLSYGQAHKLMSSINVIHPYGQIGTLPLGESAETSTPGVVGFGSQQEWLGFNPFEFSAGIRTFTEQEHDVRRQSAMHRAIYDARRIMFLGFSFQRQNMDLLRLPEELRSGSPAKDVYATGIGIHTQELEELAWSVAGIYRQPSDARPVMNKVKVELDTKCAQLFDKYRLVLGN